ncbi:hypothetical protein JCM10449v2_007739 [Rhodotorula kratochvilovae]
MASSTALQPSTAPSAPSSAHPAAAEIRLPPGSTAEWSAGDVLALVALVERHKVDGEEGEGVDWEAVGREIRQRGMGGTARSWEARFNKLAEDVKDTLSFLIVNEGAEDGDDDDDDEGRSEPLSPLMTVHELDTLLRAHDSVMSDMRTFYTFSRDDSDPQTSSNSYETWRAIHAAFASSCAQERTPPRSPRDLFIAYRQHLDGPERDAREKHALHGARFTRDKAVGGKAAACVREEVIALGGDWDRDDAGWAGAVERVANWVKVRGAAARKRTVGATIEAWYGRFDVEKGVKDEHGRDSREATLDALAAGSPVAEQLAANGPIELSQTQPRTQASSGGASPGRDECDGTREETPGDAEPEEEQEEEGGESDVDEYFPPPPKKKGEGGGKNGTAGAQRGGKSRTGKAQIAGRFSDAEDLELGALHRAGKPNSAIARAMHRTPKSVRERWDRVLGKKDYYDGVVEGVDGAEAVKGKKRAFTLSPSPSPTPTPRASSHRPASPSPSPAPTPSRARTLSPLPPPRYGASHTHASPSTTTVPQTRSASPELTAPSQRERERARKRSRTAASGVSTSVGSVAPEAALASAKVALKQALEAVEKAERGSRAGSRASK